MSAAQAISPERARALAAADAMRGRVTDPAGAVWRDMDLTARTALVAVACDVPQGVELSDYARRPWLSLPEHERAMVGSLARLLVRELGNGKAGRLTA